MRNPKDVAAMACPVCRTPLSMSDRSGIEIDYCPSCRGVWLDRGELDKIIERSNVAMVHSEEQDGDRDDRHTRQPDRGSAGGGLMGIAASMLKGDNDRYDNDRRQNYDNRYDDRYDKRRPRKKKSLLSELFD